MQTDHQTDLSGLKQELLDDPDSAHRDLIEQDIAHTERLLGLLDRALPE